jgi:hypothetical protein
LVGWLVAWQVGWCVVWLVRSLVDLVGGWFRRLVGRLVGRESSCRALWGSDFEYYSTNRKGFKLLVQVQVKGAVTLSLRKRRRNGRWPKLKSIYIRMVAGGRGAVLFHILAISSMKNWS